MASLSDLLTRVENVLAGLQSGEISRIAVLQNERDILDLQKEQLAEGKSASGEDLRPLYSEDLRAGGGWFLSSVSAANYSAWKQSISNPYGGDNRNPDAPNLYINGKFYSELGVEFGAEYVRIVGLTPYSAGIIAKYGQDSFGLSMDNWTRIMTEFGGYDRVMEQIKSMLYV